MPNNLYPDLPLTNFPGELDSFITFLDMVASDGPLIHQYMQAVESGNQAVANDILATIPQATQKIIKAVDLNKLSQAVQALERFYKSDIQPYVDKKQEEWLAKIERFSYKHEWSSGTVYQKYNMVSYVVSDVERVYIATKDVPVGTPPVNTEYWRVLTIQGIQGESGKGLNYRYKWNRNIVYSVDTAVTYDGGLWMALQTTQGNTPSLDSQYWKLIMTLDSTIYPIQDLPPTVQEIGGLWFNTSNRPTKYYYLSVLDNPATAADIRTGKQAYNQNGEMIVGTGNF